MKKAQTNSVDLDALLTNLNNEARYLEQNDVDRETLVVRLDGKVDFPTYRHAVHSHSHFNSPITREELLDLDDLDFVSNLYRKLLWREPDDEGLSYYVGRLRVGESKTRILASIMFSDEFSKSKETVSIDGMALFERCEKLLGINHINRILWPVIDLLTALCRARHSYRHNQARLTRLESETVNNYDQLAESTRIYLERILRNIPLTKHPDESTLIELGKLRTKIVGIEKELTKFLRDDREIQKHILQDNDKPIIEAPRLSKHQQLSQSDFDNFYQAFEDECRGPESDITKSLESYVDEVAAASAKYGALNPACLGQPNVLDLGCGRGEWLELLDGLSVPARGIDSNRTMVDICIEKGLDVEQSDILSHLQGIETHSLAAITGFHVIEHLTTDELIALFRQAHRVLMPGGKIIFETPNPENVLVGSHTFYHDPTHRNPLTPTFGTFLARYTGFSNVEIRRLHPYPADASVEGSDILTERFNGHFYGPQDFALIAESTGVEGV